MKIQEVTKREAELIRLYGEAKEASKLYIEAIQFAALQADTLPAVVRRYIAALASEKANAVAKEAEQMVLLFNAMPTVQGQVAA